MSREKTGDYPTHKVTVRFTKSEVAFIDMLAAKTGTSRSYTIRSLVGSWAVVSQTPLIEMLRPLEEITRLHAYRDTGKDDGDTKQP